MASLCRYVNVSRLFQPLFCALENPQGRRSGHVIFACSDGTGVQVFPWAGAQAKTCSNYVCMYTQLYAHTHRYKYKYIYIYIYLHMYVCVCVCVSCDVSLFHVMFDCLCVCVYVCIYVDVDVHIYIYIYIHVRAFFELSLYLQPRPKKYHVHRISSNFICAEGFCTPRRGDPVSSSTARQKQKVCPSAPGRCQ